MDRDQNFTSEDEMAQIEEGLTGSKLWCGVFAGQLAKVEVTVKTHPDMTQEARDRIALRMREAVRSLAVEAGAHEPDNPLVGADGLGGEETYSEDGGQAVPGTEPEPELHDSHAVGEDDAAEETEA